MIRRLSSASPSTSAGDVIAILLVVGVVYLFLQSRRTTIIPVIAIPVSLVGAFTILAVLGISINNL
jgi:multidrug efflux pump subunit AcrB